MDNGKTEPKKFKRLQPHEIEKLSKKDRKAYEIAEKKVKFLRYFRQLPVYNLAAGSAGRSPDTFHRYEQDDAVFASQVEEAKAAYAMKHAKAVKSEEWLLERVIKNHFSPKIDVEHSASSELQKALDRVSKVLPKAQT